MPVPKTKDVGKLIKFFKKENPKWPHEQVIAAALNSARRAGAEIKPPAEKRPKPRRKK